MPDLLQITPDFFLASSAMIIGMAGAIGAFVTGIAAAIIFKPQIDKCIKHAKAYVADINDIQPEIPTIRIKRKLRFFKDAVNNSSDGNLTNQNYNAKGFT